MPIEKKYGGTGNPPCRPVLCKKKDVDPACPASRRWERRSVSVSLESGCLTVWLLPQSVLPACSHLDGEIPQSDRDSVCRQGHPAGGDVDPSHRICVRGRSVSSADNRPCLSCPGSSSAPYLDPSSTSRHPAAQPVLMPQRVLPACSHLDGGESTLITPPAVRRIHMPDPQQHHPGEPIGFMRLYHGVHGYS